MSNTTSTTNSYKSLISRDEKAIAADLVDIKVQEASLEVNYSILAVDKAIAKATSKVAAAKSATPFVPANVINASRELADLKADKEALVALKSELFPA